MYRIVFVVLRLVDFGEGQALDVLNVPPPGREIGLNMYVLADVHSFQLEQISLASLHGSCAL